MTTYDFELQARRRAVGRPVEPAPNALVASIFGRNTWREWLHPRDRHGRWIEKNSRVKVLGWGGGGDTYVGSVERLNRDGSVSVRVTSGAHTGSVIKAAPHQVEKISAKAFLPELPPPPPPAQKVEKPRGPYSPFRPIFTGDAVDLGTTYDEVAESLRDQPIVTFDYETTGIHSEAGHRGVEVAAVRTVNGEVVDRFHSLMNPGRPIDPEASAINGITDEQVSGAPSHIDVAKQLKDFIGDSVVSAHNTSYDLGFLQASLRDGGDNWEPRGAIDTLAMARSLLKAKAKGGPVDNHKLQTLADFFNLELERAHSADADTEATAHLLGALIRYAQDHGATLADMRALEEKWRAALPEYYDKLDSFLAQDS